MILINADKMKTNKFITVIIQKSTLYIFVILINVKKTFLN